MTSQDPEVTSNQPEEEIPLISPRLKALVLWQGVAIIVGIVVIFGTLAYRAINMIPDTPEKTVVTTNAPLTEVSPSVLSKVGSVQAPQGSNLHKVHAGEVVVTLEFLHDNGQTTLIFIDVASGTERNRLIIKSP